MSGQRIPSSYHERLTSGRDELTRLDACWREFMRHSSPRVLLVGIAPALAGRLALGGWSWRDAVLPLALLAAQPFVEWAIHKYLLHLPPLRLRGRRIELYGSVQHRKHHLAPSDLDRVLLSRVEVLTFLVQIAIVVGALALALGDATRSSSLPLALTGITFAYLGLLRYEWSHFLIHTPYVPKTSWYRAIWRNHRLHHFKHEGYWMGVSSNLGDRLLGTNPDQRSVTRSPTARTLGIDAE